MSDPLADAQALLNKAQTSFLGADPSKEQMSAWFNACLNSACGPIGDKYGNVAVYGLLKVWMASVESRLTPEEKG